MRIRKAWLASLLILAFGIFVALSLTRGQDPNTTPPVSLPKPPTADSPPRAPAHELVKRPIRDLSKLPPLQKQVYLSALAGAGWLHRANGPDGRFGYGYIPALKTPMEGDHFLRQAGAAVALARAARFTGDPHHAARATQAIVALLGDTVVDEQDSQVRHTTFPNAAVNRLAAAGLLVLAIQELPEPAKDLLDKSEQMCNFIRKQQRADGSLAYADTAKTEADDPDGVNYYPGEALYGLMRSQQRQPAAWKTELARRALAYYRPWWRQHKSMAFVPWHTAACTEAYLLTKEQTFAEFVYEMNDWLCGLQYERLEPRQVLWYGGFMGWSEGKAVESAPQVSSASYAEGLAEACRVTSAAGDLTRHRRYTDALERCLQFLTTLQYTESNTRHFAEWYRPMLLGAFHASHQDGDLRIDYTQHAVCAMVQYMTYVAQ
jgi:hypothetical protein